MKKSYLDLMEQCFLQYGEANFLRVLDTNYTNGIKEHGFPRLTANLAILVAHGRQIQYTHDVVRMMDFCCREMARPCVGGQGNEFAVGELVLALLALEQQSTFSPSVTARMRASLAAIQPTECYHVIAKDENDTVNNWAAFGAFSEWMRVHAGICRREDTIDFIDRQLASQLRMIDEYSMYRDPHEPMLYDLVPRHLFALLLYFGYNGRHHDKLREVVERSAVITMQMQSVTGELPFGGRSNQFMHNEAYLASMMEFYAVFFRKAGNPVTAGMCKSSARLARENIAEWMCRAPARHVKNRFSPSDNPLGCERYAYFDKYMITAASMCYQAYIVADDHIAEVPCPALSGQGITLTSPHFHKLFLRHGEYALAFDLRADIHYDGSGLGRVHKKGVPGPLALSVPFPDAEAQYHIDRRQDACALCGFLPDIERGVASYTADGYRLISRETDEHAVSVTLQAVINDTHTLTEQYRLDDNGVTVTVTSEQTVGYHVPVFYFDGTDCTVISLTDGGHTLTVIYEEHTCTYHCADAVFIDTDSLLTNRNGHYRHYILKADKKLTLTLTLS